MRKLSVGDRSRCGNCGRIVPSLEEYGGQGRCRDCYEEPASGPDVDRELRIRAEAAATVTPDGVKCATCGGEAHAATWGKASGTTYRCRDCHAGGEIVASPVRATSSSASRTSPRAVSRATEVSPDERRRAASRAAGVEHIGRHRFSTDG